jgi:hypothetical protein
MGTHHVNRRLSARLILPVLLASGAAIPGLAAAAGFSLTCQALDPATGLVRNVFAPGETMLISYAAEVPPEAEDQEIDVKLSMRVRIGGISIPYTLDELKLGMPNQPPVPGDGALPIQGYFSDSSAVDIPAGIPDGDVTLRAKATIEGVGKRSCQIKVEVAAPAP